MLIKRLAFMLLIASLAISVRAETINCKPITSLPATISSQGIYCLTGRLTTSQNSGYAITITAKNVTLDLNGWMLAGQSAGTSTYATGIYSNGNNVTIKNGIVRGFYIGIFLTGSGSEVRDMLMDQNTYTGIQVNSLGGVSVAHNQIIGTGGSTYADSVSAVGISTFGSDTTVSDNIISGLTATGSGNEYGINLNSYNSTVRNNIISNTSLPSGGGISYGIFQYLSIALNNTVSNFDYGIYNNGGIYAYNTANDCTTNFYGGTAGAGNSP
jgi:hypothetical protein